MIHRAWEGPRPEWVNWTEEVVRSVHPSERVVTKELDPNLLGPTPRRRSNGWRLTQLYEEGGLWLDVDVIPLVNLVKLHDEPWAAFAGGLYRPMVMCFPEAHDSILARTLEMFVEEPDTVLALHLTRAAQGELLQETRVLPHSREGRLLLPLSVSPLAVHLWKSEEW